MSNFCHSFRLDQSNNLSFKVVFILNRLTSDTCIRAQNSNKPTGHVMLMGVYLTCTDHLTLTLNDPLCRTEDCLLKWFILIWYQTTFSKSIRIWNHCQQGIAHLVSIELISCGTSFRGIVQFYCITDSGVWEMFLTDQKKRFCQKRF